MDLLLHFKVNEGDENNINIQEYMLYGDVEIKCEKCLVDEGDEVVLTEFPVPEFKNCTLMKIKIIVRVKMQNLQVDMQYQVFYSRTNVLILIM